MADTIAAIATAPAVAAIAIIRLSGDQSVAIANHVFRSKQNLSDHPREMLYGNFINREKSLLDHGLAVYMKAPNSYTGEDTVEFYCHGSLIVQRELLATIYSAGARPAEPGEFTQRAFLNGKMDLVQAEAVIDLIDAETVDCAKNAAAQMEGRMGSGITSIRDQLLDIIASFYAYVDYPDEEIDEPTLLQTLKALTEIRDFLDQMISSFDQGQIMKNGVQCALIGRPNAGKSSVLNTLLGFERSIVSDIPGTTRDTIEEKVRIGNVILNLIDTAGLRQSEDEIEKIGIARATKAAESAELILAVFDGTVPLESADEEVLAIAQNRNAIALINKNDLSLCIDIEKIRGTFGSRVCIISAQKKEGFDELRRQIAEMFDMIALPCDGRTVTNARHAAALEKAQDHVLQALSILQEGFTPDIATSDLELAVDALGEITGQTASEQVLTRIFERFCVGK